MKEEIKKLTIVSTIYKTVDTFEIIATTSTSVTLTITGFVLYLIAISNRFACRLTFSKTCSFQKILNKYSNKKNLETIMGGLDKLLPLLINYLENLLDKEPFLKNNSYRYCNWWKKLCSLCKIFTRYISEILNHFFSEKTFI